MWSQRNNNNYEQTGLLTALNYFADNGQQFLKNFYLKSKRSIEKPQRRRPGRLRVPGRRQAHAARRRSCCGCCSCSTSEISRIDARRSRSTPAGDARRRRRTASARTASRSTAHVRRRQLRRAHGPAVLAHRRRPARPPVLGAEGSAEASVRRHRLVDGRPVRRAGRARHRQRDPQGADDARRRARRGAARPRRRSTCRRGEAAAHRADAHLARAPRPKAGGAWRWTSCRCRTTTSAPRTCAHAGNLRAKYDVILFGRSAAPARSSIVDGLPMWGNPMPWKTTQLTPNLGRIDATDDIRPGLGAERRRPPQAVRATTAAC